MAGGAGTRLWPASRVNRPKQLLKLVGGQSLLRASYERVASLLGPGSIYVITGADHLPLVADELPELPNENLIGEPCGRDTANAVGLASAVLQQRDPEAITGFFTADHVITPTASFVAAVNCGFRVAAENADALVTFGIKPHSPHTGYGYIERGERVDDGVHQVAQFTEKPDARRAGEYLEGGQHVWNSGMFVWRNRTVLDQLREHLPESYEGVMEIARQWDTPERKATLQRIYATLPKTSIDYAVMERAPRVFVVDMDCEWLDVGSWPALEGVIPADPDGNVNAGATVLHLDSRGNLVAADEEHLVATLGVENLVIVHTRDATLVARKDQAGELKTLVKALQDKHGHRYL
jgi:mannose-1-phosphate guanylyltransferase